VRHELKLISHLYNIAASEWSIPVENPLRAMKMPSQGKARERRVSREEEAYLVDAAEHSGAIDKNGKSRANPWISPIIRFALSTGMRQGEILALEWRHIDKTKRTATLVDTKNGDRRVVPLAPSALANLDALPRTLHGPVFPTTTEALRQSWARAVRRARKAYLSNCATGGIEADPHFLVDLHFHDLRHEAISRLFELRPQIDIMRIAQISGHKTLQMLKRYTHLHSADTADMLAAAGA
jgi:integrase